MGIDRSSAADHLDGWRESDDSRDTRRAAPARKHSQVHLWKTKLSPRIIRKQSTVTPRRQFSSAASASSLNRSDGHKRHPTQLDEELLTLSAAIEHAILPGYRSENPDLEFG